MSVFLPWVYDTVNDALTGASLKAMLVKDPFDYDTTQHYRDDIDADEVTGTGYTAGGVNVTGVVLSQDTVNGLVKLDCDDIDFGTLALDDDITGVVIYIDTGSSATDILVAVDTFSATGTDGSDHTTYVVSGNGFVVLEVA